MIEPPLGNSLVKNNSTIQPNNYLSSGNLEIYLESELPYTYEKNTYDVFNRLASTKTDTGINATYEYYPDNLRLSKTVNGAYTGFIWDGSQITAEFDSDYNLTNIYMFGRGQSRISGTNLNTNKKTYYMYNTHGDVQGLINRAGDLTKNYEYDAFGNEIDKVDTDTNPFRYCGEYYDTETGNIYLRARYYDPSTGGFISEDPIRDGYNWYSYCGGNPVIYIDKTGLAKKYVLYTNDTSSDDSIKPKEQAEIIAEMHKETYGDTVEIVHITSSQDFVDWWNNESPEEMDFVEVISHGVVEYKNTGRSDYGIGSLAFEDGSVLYASDSTVSYDLECNNMLDLTKTKKIDYLYFSSCNSANPDVKNIAQAFADKNPDIKIVGGWDGGVAFVKRRFDVTEYRDMPTPMKNNDTFKHFADKNKKGLFIRRRLGYVEISNEKD